MAGTMRVSVGLLEKARVWTRMRESRVYHVSSRSRPMKREDPPCHYSNEGGNVDFR